MKLSVGRWLWWMAWPWFAWAFMQVTTSTENHWHRVIATTRQIRDTLDTSILRSLSESIYVFIYCLDVSILLIYSFSTLAPSALGHKACRSLSQLLLGQGRMDELPVYRRERNSPSYQQKILQFWICLTCMFWVGGRKPEYPEWTHADLQTPHRKVPRAWGWTRHFLTVGCRRYCSFFNCSPVLFLLFRNSQLSKWKTFNYDKEKGNWTLWIRDGFAGHIPAGAPAEPHCVDEEATGTGSEHHRWETTNAHLPALAASSPTERTPWSTADSSWPWVSCSAETAGSFFFSPPSGQTVSTAFFFFFFGAYFTTLSVHAHNKTVAEREWRWMRVGSSIFMGP